MRLIIRGASLAVAAAIGLAACGGGGSSPSPAPTPDPGTTITLTSAGASPRNLVVPRGSQVTFVNNDGAVHQMYSDPHPEHTDCPEFDSVGQLLQGQTRRTTNLVIPRTCGFHDHLNASNLTLRGTVTVQ